MNGCPLFRRRMHTPACLAFARVSPPTHHMALCAEEEGGWAELPEELLLKVGCEVK
jgi:hypothetical protein